MRESSDNKLQTDLDQQTSKVAELDTKLHKVQQELLCQRHNAEAMKNKLEARMKDQEKEMKNETSLAQSSLAAVGQQLEDTRKQLSQVQTAARQQENNLKAQLEKLEGLKR